jgi:hypothetical protein
VVPPLPPELLNLISVLSLYLLTLKFVTVQHWVPIETVVYIFPSMSETVEGPHEKVGVTTAGILETTP